jgi:3-oxoadipate enol-lactonase
MPRAKIGDIEMNYMTEGVGDWVVVIGGFATGHWQSWARYLPALTARYRVLAFDSRGAGATDAPDQPYTTAMMAADTVGLMRYLGIDRAHVIGRSLGGAIAQEVALQAPELVRSLAMSSSFANIGRRGRILIDHWIAAVTELGFERFFAYLMTYFFTAEFYEQRYADVERTIKGLLDTPRSVRGFVNTGHAVKTHDTLDRLARITVPTFAVCGDEDLITPPRHTEEMGQRLPAGEVHIVGRGSHGYLTEHPQSFDRFMAFLARH